MVEMLEKMYDIYPAHERGRCHICGTVKELFYMREMQKYINPVTKKESITRYGCDIHDAACFECHEKYAKENGMCAWKMVGEGE